MGSSLSFRCWNWRLMICSHEDDFCLDLCHPFRAWTMFFISYPWARPNGINHNIYSRLSSSGRTYTHGYEMSAFQALRFSPVCSLCHSTVVSLRKSFSAITMPIAIGMSSSPFQIVLVQDENLCR